MKLSIRASPIQNRNMATKKRNVKRTTTVRAVAKPKRRRTAISSRRTKKTNNIFNFVVPFVFLLAILGCLGFLLYKGYQTVTASSFFDVRKVEIRGNSRVSKQDIEKIVRMHANRDGVWNAELEQIKTDVEKLNFVKSAVVSRILPDGILVNVTEPIPRAIVRLNNTDVWVDDEAMIVGAVGKNEARPLFLLRGWDEDKTEKARKDNQERVKLFLKIQEEFKNFGVEKFVTLADLSDLQDAEISVENSGKTVSVRLGKEDFGKRLLKALDVIKSKGDSIESLTSHGGLPFGK
jgi:cell division septal protein FtsQ